ncbi:glycosyltransferase family 31 protein [Acidomyces richmondensis BFW]|nr:MAG: glycosyltransferase family 31 protein [Acidomyces sp. 'richmondensis']KYG43730.1 glycosyltransferase family 31 protein [Acidomyces richmondensis BFW]
MQIATPFRFRTTAALKAFTLAVFALIVFICLASPSPRIQLPRQRRLRFQRPLPLNRAASIDYTDTGAASKETIATKDESSRPTDIPLVDDETKPTSSFDKPGENEGWSGQSSDAVTGTSTASFLSSSTRRSCYSLEGADDVVVIIKTGSTESEEKLPVHFNKTLQCFPHYLIFSDYAEIVDDHVILDALENVTADIRLEHEDFDLWRRLQADGRAALDESELSVNDQGDPASPFGNPENGGWRLDRFKNLPLVGKTLEHKPDAKWYIVVDADTYVVWSNLLQWLKHLDHTKPMYLGSATFVDDQVFAHGGSGYILSSPAMHAAADAYMEEQEEWDRFAADHWAGDCVFGTFMERKQIANLTWSFPSLQGSDPTTLDWTQITDDKRMWCYPAVTYHHLKPSTVEALWDIEQEWIEDSGGKSLTHGDMFKKFALSRLKHERVAWDNLSEDELEGHQTSDALDCRAVCESDTSCIQYSYRDRVCKTARIPKIGREDVDGVHYAGWMLGRIHNLVRDLDDCHEGGWILD